MRRRVAVHIALTALFWLLGVAVAILTTFMYALIRGDLMFDGGFRSGHTWYWIGLNFRAFLPSFLAVGSVLGVLVGQVQFWAWVTHPHRLDQDGNK